MNYWEDLAQQQRPAHGRENFLKEDEVRSPLKDDDFENVKGGSQVV